MKKILLLIFIAFSSNLFSQMDYAEINHQQITNEAFWALSRQGNYYSIIAQNLGYIGYVGNSWENGYILSGAALEDQLDVVFGHSGWLTTVSHFWDADNRTYGDFTLSNLGIIGSFKNAYNKAYLYQHGGWYDMNNNPSWIQVGGGHYMYYDNTQTGDDGLIDLYKTRRMFHLETQTWVIVDENTRDKLVWEILGRMCHLLQDMTVPAHAHCHIHAPIISSGDAYESYIESLGNIANYVNRNNCGSWVNPFSDPYGNYWPPDAIRYLFYNANQIGDFFPNGGSCNGSPSNNGDNYRYNMIYGEGTYPYLNYHYAIYGGTPNNNEVYCQNQLYTNLTNAMRLTSGLLYWFAHQTNMTAIQTPTIKNFSQNPPAVPIYTQGFTITANLYNSNQYNTTTFYWTFEPETNVIGYSISNPFGRTIMINYTPSENSSEPDKILKLKCRAYNQYGQESYKTYSVIFGTYIGCPWLYVMNCDTFPTSDNNLLNKSKYLGYVGQNINDKYILRVNPGIIDNQISLNIAETSNDTSYINYIKLYAIDHTEGTKVCITEDNQIAIFDSASVLSVKEAFLNENEITENIQFHILPKIVIQSDTLDHINASFNNNNIINPGIIAELKFNPLAPSQQKNYDGLISSNLGSEMFYSLFSKREYKSITAIPVTSESADELSVNNIEIDWYKGNDIRYIALASLSYNTFILTELPIAEALNITENEDISKDEILNIISEDTLYCEISPSKALSLKYWSIKPPNSGIIRDYLIEVNGRIGLYLNPLQKYKPNKLKNIKKKNNSVIIINKLNQNYPNPFNPLTKISYSVAKQGLVTIKIYDILGREIKSLVNEIKGPGNYIIEFNGSNLASGVYYYKLETNGFVDVKRMVFIK